ncbi:hypothetical protein CPB86DRAFT_821953 [Serendipita vermifera]|nr:hypothetical protein CPB86DRAFT_821953 [Serendipita vermifera]
MTNTVSFSVIQTAYDEGRLQESRIQLLNTIRQLQGSKDFGPGEFETLRAARSRYNEIVDSINTLYDSSRSDPIDKLPPELFAEIIRDAVDNVSRQMEIKDFLSSLTLVSTRWRGFITSTPVYWTSISLDYNRPDTFSSTRTFLKLSGDLPVTLSLTYYVTMENSIIWQELVKNRHRITHLDYRHGLYEMDQDKFEATFRSCMRTLSPLPALKSLVNNNSGPSFRCAVTQYALDICPNLTETCGLDLNKKSIQRLMLRGCKSIWVEQKLEAVWPLLEANPSLSEVQCPERLREKRTSPIISDHLNWNSLFMGHINLPLAIGITEKMTQLAELKVEGYFSTLVQLLTNTHRLFRLRELQLTLAIDGPMPNEEDLPISFSSNSAVIKLCLCLESKENDDLSASENDRSPFEPGRVHKIKEFAGLVIQGLPAIRDLSLILHRSPQISRLNHLFDIGVLENLLYLQYLYLSSNLPIDPSELPPCDTIDLSCRDQKDFIHLSSRKTRHLQVSCPIWKVDQTLEDKSWPFLETLSIPVCLLLNSQKGFPHLREITIDSSYLGSVTEFCRDLALYPELCPALEGLCLDECPEWDILFIMLERRLVSGVNGATALKWISLRGDTPRSILIYICKILGGWLPERPSNFDLSLLSKADVLLDKTVTDCAACIGLGRKCQFTTLITSIEPPNEQQGSQWIKSLPKYPQNEDEILQSWEKRNGAWNEGVLLAQFRYDRCPSFSSIKIDRFSHFGEPVITVESV